MKVMVVGSRNIESFDISEYIPADAELIISGGAKGMDSIAEKYADQHRVSKLILRPNYKVYGKAAPIKRNECMVDLADYVLIVWDGASRGTMHTLNYVKKKNKQYQLIVLSQ